METFGRRLKALRDERKITQEGLAQLFNLSQSTIGYYETDKKQPSQKTLIKFARFFNVSIDYLLGESDDPKPKDQHVNDDEALEYLDELHKRPEMKTLFEVGRKATKEDIETAITVIEALKKKGGHEE